MNRPRACAAILNDSKILMVCHQTPSRTYWTLPGGGWEVGETIEQTAIREVKEETGLNIEVIKLLFEENYEYGNCYCYLAKLMDENIEPTLAFLPKEESLFGTMLQSAAWHSLKDKKDDIQVSKVIAILNITIT
jgi:8-oxo-dGTP diphosphatase